MFVDPHEGYFDFTDDTFTAFKGKADIPYLGTSVDIEGFKIASGARNQAEDWGTFSEAAYERARVGRWH